jgi:hypothetical protein
MNDSQDPLDALASYYGRLHTTPVPVIALKSPMRWWEPVGGLAAGAALVLFVVAIGSGQKPSIPLGAAPLLERQMEQAGLTVEKPKPLWRTDRGASWHA